MFEVHARRVAQVVTAAALLVAASGARADALRFIGDRWARDLAAWFIQMNRRWDELVVRGRIELPT